MTGTREYAAIVITRSWADVRITMRSAMLEIIRAVSLKGSPRLNWLSPGAKNNAWPPNCDAATSNETRVRVDVFSNNIAMVMPVIRDAEGLECRLAFINAARSIRWLSSFELKSSRVRKCLGFIVWEIIEYSFQRK